MAEDLSSSPRLSLSVSFRSFHGDPAPENALVFLVANIQLYQGYLFFGFVCFYLLTLGRKARRLQPRLYNLKGDLGAKTRPPLLLSDCRRSYRTNDLLLILQDRERWAVGLRNSLGLHPHLIYTGAGEDSWLASLKIVLDASAALIVSCEPGAVRRQAGLTFGAARRALVEATGQLGLDPKNDAAAAVSASAFRPEDDEPAGADDGVLSAGWVLEAKEFSALARRIERFDLWRLTYEPHWRALTGELGGEPHRRRHAAAAAGGRLKDLACGGTTPAGEN